MIPDHMEPKGLEADAEPIGGTEFVVRSGKAARASADLRDAILASMGQPVPIRLKDGRPRSLIRKKRKSPQRYRRDLVVCETVTRLRRRVAEHYGLTVDELLLERRRHALQRQVGMYLLRELTERSYPDIARLFGRSDHTTAMYAVRHIEKLRAERPDLNESLEYLREELAA